MRYFVCVFCVFLYVGVNAQQNDGGEASQVRVYISENWGSTVMQATNVRDDLIPLPHPYSVPTVEGETAFKAMFYWDTYFTNLGLLRDGQEVQAKNNVDNIIYLVDTYGKMPNASTKAMLNRSQPPYLSMMIADVFEYGKDTVWLREAVQTLEKEYRFWMTNRVTPNGLNRYSSSATSSEKIGMAKLWASRSGDERMLQGKSEAEMVRMGGHVLAEAESGWDFTPRFDNRCEDFNPVDLNSNLYLYERNFARFYRALGAETTAAAWDKAASQRKALMERYCIDAATGLFADYDFVNQRHADVVSAALFSVLYSGLADQEQAAAIVRALGLLETPYGIKTCAEGPRSFTYQWDTPNGWPPLHYLAVKGLYDYGYLEEGRRIGNKYLNTVTENFRRTRHLWEKYNVDDGSVNTVNEYEMPKFLGWTAGVFVAIADLLSTHRDHYAGLRDSWLEKARANIPELISTKRYPLRLVEIAHAPEAFQGYAAANARNVNTLYVCPFSKEEPVVLDFGEHLTGTFHFSLRALNRVADAPVKLRFTFGEVPSEVATAFDPYPGSLARGWLQDEEVTVMTMSDTVVLDRRMAFRYVKVEAIGLPNYDFAFSTAYCMATTSASGKPDNLAAGTDPMVAQIDRIGLLTLKECMQTVFEDGPKRDRRLWIGDLYLQSMANMYSFDQQDLTRRCLYLLAGVSDTSGYLYPTLFERPFPHAQRGPFLLEYALLYNATLNAYLDATGDMETAKDLWPVARRQIDIVRDLVGDDGMVNYVQAIKDYWVFFDWNDKLHKEAALQGFMVFALKESYELASRLGKEGEIADVPALTNKLARAALERMYDRKRQLFVGTLDSQLSYASQLWMVLGGVVKGQRARDLLRKVDEQVDAVKPNSPYLYHYYIQALVNSGLHAEAKDRLTAYWGSMVKKGADTFWEVFNEGNDYLSPYGFYPMNSYCHAWSCTPVYFIRKYPAIFQ
ncbi:trehalase family glycosidase [Parapedobacter sp. 2B3]|uniref:trehalase family glycosidase n=1 Tax=Parapedobacter sp. 2B3 TaxID=3342381 RepID=UPI0035B5739B